MRAVVSAVRPVPPLAALLFSEAVHLRSVLDNVVWFLAARVHPTEELSDSARRAIALPVHTDPNRYDKWAGARVKDGLAVFAPSHNIGARIRRVQPFADASSSVASSSEIMAYLMGAQVERAHPLQLLQGYSNDDKHRTIRIGVPRATSTRLDQPLLGQNRGFREMAV